MVLQRLRLFYFVPTWDEIEALHFLIRSYYDAGFCEQAYPNFWPNWPEVHLSVSRSMKRSFDHSSYSKRAKCQCSRIKTQVDKMQLAWYTIGGQNIIQIVEMKRAYIKYDPFEVRMKFVWETPEEVNLALAQRLARIRKRRNLSQQALSKKSNVSFGSIKRFETSGQISLISLTKLCIALDCADEIKKLFTGVEYGSIEEVLRERT